jgi:hypothetical protein
MSTVVKPHVSVVWVHCCMRVWTMLVLSGFSTTSSHKSNKTALTRLCSPGAQHSNRRSLTGRTRRRLYLIQPVSFSYDTRLSHTATRSHRSAATNGFASLEFHSNTTLHRLTHRQRHRRPQAHARLLHCTPRLASTPCVPKLVPVPSSSSLAAWSIPPSPFPLRCQPDTDTIRSRSRGLRCVACLLGVTGVRRDSGASGEGLRRPRSGRRFAKGLFRLVLLDYTMHPSLSTVQATNLFP